VATGAASPAKRAGADFEQVGEGLMEQVTVEQVDRDAAVGYASDFLNWNGYLRTEVRCGRCDQHPLVQTFARHRLNSRPETSSQCAGGAGLVHIVFDGPPGPNAGRFIEVETPDGRSVSFGEWHERADGYWELRILAALSAAPAKEPTDGE